MVVKSAEKKYLFGIRAGVHAAPTLEKRKLDMANHHLPALLVIMGFAWPAPQGAWMQRCRNMSTSVHRLAVREEPHTTLGAFRRGRRSAFLTARWAILRWAQHRRCLSNSEPLHSTTPSRTAPSRPTRPSPRPWTCGVSPLPVRPCTLRVHEPRRRPLRGVSSRALVCDVERGVRPFSSLPSATADADSILAPATSPTSSTS